MKPHVPAGELIAEMAQRIALRMHPQRIILFGSYARGTPTADSDVDLLVVMPANGSKRELAVTIYGLLAGMGLPKDVVVVTPDEVVRYGKVVGSVIRTALKEGKVLFESKS
jgi:predicted nucleotidyltransferase